MTHLSPDPEIRLRQKYDPSNRPFEDSLFKFAGGEPPGATNDSGESLQNSTEERSHKTPRRDDLPAIIQVSAGSEGRQAGGVSLELESAPADICANKHKGAETSIAAHQRIAATSSDMRAEIYRFALKRAGFGITVKEVEGEFNMLRNSASARLSELKVRGLLEKRGDTRESCAVLVPRFAEAK